MASLDQLTDEARTIAERLVADRKLDPAVAARYAAADVALRAYGFRGAPEITSGFRDPADVRRLLRRYEAGDPGIVYKPARQSWHLPDPRSGLARAIDVNRQDPAFQYFEAIWRNLDGRVGSDFGDPVHFDVPGTEAPRPAY